jgi:hypothetical protein
MESCNKRLEEQRKQYGSGKHIWLNLLGIHFFAKYDENNYSFSTYHTQY